MPVAFNTTTEAWENYVACIWKELFVHFELTKDAVIIEVGGGCSSKIGLALQKIDFAGTIYLVDPLSSALEIAYKNYKKLLPKAIVPRENKKSTALPRPPLSRR